MAYITAQELADYAGKHPKENDGKPQKYADAAMDTVNRYLGYNPEEALYTTTRFGDEGTLFSVEAYPVTQIHTVTVNGTADNVQNYVISDSKKYIARQRDARFRCCDMYQIAYKAGFEEVPEIIKMTALQIGSLLWESASGNLAVSSTSYADTGSRVFNNFTPDRYLKQIEDYKKGI